MKIFWKKLYRFIKQLLFQCVVGNLVFSLLASIVFFLKMEEDKIADYFGELLAWLIILPAIGLPIYIGSTLTTAIWLKNYGNNGIGYPVLAYIFVTFIYTFKFLGNLIPFCTNILLVNILVAFITSILLMVVCQLKREKKV